MEDLEISIQQILSGKDVPNHILVPLNPVWPELEQPPRANAKLYYVGLKDSVPMLQEFCAILRGSLVDFCLPRTTLLEARERYAETEDEVVFYDLFSKARSLFIKARKETKRSGEGGELILFSLLEAMGCPQLVSKMYLKTSSQMPVHGSDGLHVGYDAHKKQMTVYVGESKLHAEFDAGLSDALKSVIDLTSDSSKLSREFELVTDHVDKSGLTPEFASVLKGYFDPYSESTVDRRECHACLIGFDVSFYTKVQSFPHEKAKKEIEKNIESFATAKLKNLKGRLSKEKYSNLNFVFLFLPFPSVEEFRSVFNSKVLGI